ncbi:MAG: DUF2071 domain-containing protein [Verrucomicrobiota bacterium]
MKIKTNPLTMRGALNGCWLFNYRTPLEKVQALVPEPLKLVTHGGFAFWNIVVCRVEALRPAPLPGMFGLGYWHVAYRLCVDAHLASGGQVEGLYFVRSECDHSLIARVGNWMTDFAFHPARITVLHNREIAAGEIVATGGHAHFCVARQEMPGLAEGSPFGSLEEAATFLAYRPCALSRANGNAVQRVGVSRDEARWRCRPVAVKTASWSLLHDAKLELCFEVEPIDYQWNRGEILEVAA